MTGFQPFEQQPHFTTGHEALIEPSVDHSTHMVWRWARKRMIWILFSGAGERRRFSLSLAYRHRMGGGRNFDECIPLATAASNSIYSFN